MFVMNMNGPQEDATMKKLIQAKNIDLGGDQRDQYFGALQKVVLEPSLLDSFKYFLKFR